MLSDGVSKYDMLLIFSSIYDQTLTVSDLKIIMLVRLEMNI